MMLHLTVKSAERHDPGVLTVILLDVSFGRAGTRKCNKDREDEIRKLVTSLSQTLKCIEVL